MANVLGAAKLVAFLPTTHADRAAKFFRDKLGLKLVSDERPFALVFDANGTMLRVTIVNELKAHPFTVLGWEVADIEETMDRLAGAGIAFLRFPGMNDKDARGIWTAPSGARIAWFNDPDGNVLSLTEFGGK